MDNQETQKPPMGGAVQKTVHSVFAKIQKKTGLQDEKIEKFQKTWLALPENRTKYEHLTNAPAVAGEELFAMVNDIIDFVQNQEGGQSHIFQALKREKDEIVKNPEAYLKNIYEFGKKWAQIGLNKTEHWMGQSKAQPQTQKPAETTPILPPVQTPLIEPPKPVEKKEIEITETKVPPQKKAEKMVKKTKKTKTEKTAQKTTKTKVKSTKSIKRPDKSTKKSAKK